MSPVNGIYYSRSAGVSHKLPCTITDNYMLLYLTNVLVSKFVMCRLTVYNTHDMLPVWSKDITTYKGLVLEFILSAFV